MALLNREVSKDAQELLLLEWGQPTLPLGKVFVENGIF